MMLRQVACLAVHPSCSRHGSRDGCDYIFLALLRMSPPLLLRKTRTMKNILAKLVSSLIAGFAFVAPVQAETRPECIASAGAIYEAGFIAYQVGLRDLANSHRLDFASLAEINMEFQNTMARLRAAQIVWLADNHPDWLKTDEGGNAFLNFSWPKGMQDAFMEADTGHLTLDAEVQKWGALNEDHPDWPALRAWMGSEGVNLPEFSTFTEKLTKSRQILDLHLRGCDSR